MKFYEKNFSLPQAIPFLPVIARLDGRAFHTWTKGFKRPFDHDFMDLMDMVTMRLVKEANAIIGYTQSDEISLLFYSSDPKSQIFFDGKMAKINSILASMCTVYFNEEIDFKNSIIIAHSPVSGPEDEDVYLNPKPAQFDCRVWQVPNLREAGLYLLWREEDAVRNSIQAVGQTNFSHTKLHKKSLKEIQEMLFQTYKINWNDFTSREKRGSYYRRESYDSTPSKEELKGLPPKHHAHTDPDFRVTRHHVAGAKLPPLVRIANREDVLFEGTKPQEYDIKETVQK